MYIGIIDSMDLIVVGKLVLVMICFDGVDWFDVVDFLLVMGLNHSNLLMLLFVFGGVLF